MSSVGRNFAITGCSTLIFFSCSTDQTRVDLDFTITASVCFLLVNNDIVIYYNICHISIFKYLLYKRWLGGTSLVGQMLLIDDKIHHKYLYTYMDISDRRSPNLSVIELILCMAHWLLSKEENEDPNSIKFLLSRFKVSILHPATPIAKILVIWLSNTHFGMKINLIKILTGLFQRNEWGFKVIDRVSLNIRHYWKFTIEMEKITENCDPPNCHR